MHLEALERLRRHLAACEPEDFQAARAEAAQMREQYPTEIAFLFPAEQEWVRERCAQNHPPLHLVQNVEDEE